MNFEKFINSNYLKDNPLCGIGTSKDELNLANGACTRRIKKLVFDGTENVDLNTVDRNRLIIQAVYTLPKSGTTTATNIICTHLVTLDSGAATSLQQGIAMRYNGTDILFGVPFSLVGATTEDSNAALRTKVKAYLAAQYAAGTPVTVWYVLSSPITETITVPSGLSGTVEGYLNQSGTPTPTNPIYPTANTVEQWFDLNHYIMGTDTDTITTLPADIYPNDTTATVGLKGNMSQTGTPTPQNPIMPQETGERTGNLAQWEKGGINTSTGANEAYRTKEQGGTCEQLRTQYIPCIGDSTYVLSVNKYPVQSFISFYDENKNYLSRTPGYQQSGTRSFRADINAKYMRAQLAHVLEDHVYPAIEENAQFAITLGSTALSYEPYGYKLDISSASTTTPIYLGEVESTRRIKKLVLTGEEAFTKNNGQSTNYLYYANRATILPGSIGRTPILCNELPTRVDAPQVGIGINTANAFSVVYFNFEADIMNAQPSGNTVAGLKEYLAAQYAAGTPVTVWYVLATPTTGVVNEPLRKIGDYADEVSGISIPVTAGGDTISVDTTVQPSEVTVSYKGWHPVLNVHEKSMNLFDKSTAAAGYGVDDNSGNLFRSAALSASDYINISGESYVRATYITSGVANQYGAFYDENKTYISGYSDYSNAIAVPQNAVYTRITARTEYIDEFMLNAGSSALPYEPYWK